MSAFAFFVLDFAWSYLTTRKLACERHASRTAKKDDTRYVVSDEQGMATTCGYISLMVAAKWVREKARLVVCPTLKDIAAFWVTTDAENFGMKDYRWLNIHMCLRRSESPPPLTNLEVNRFCCDTLSSLVRLVTPPEFQRTSLCVFLPPIGMQKMGHFFCIIVIRNPEHGRQMVMLGAKDGRITFTCQGSEVNAPQPKATPEDPKALFEKKATGWGCKACAKAVTTGVKRKHAQASKNTWIEYRVADNNNIRRAQNKHLSSSGFHQAAVAAATSNAATPPPKIVPPPKEKVDLFSRLHCVMYAGIMHGTEHTTVAATIAGLRGSIPKKYACARHVGEMVHVWAGALQERVKKELKSVSSIGMVTDGTSLRNVNQDVNVFLLRYLHRPSPKATLRCVERFVRMTDNVLVSADGDALHEQMKAMLLTVDLPEERVGGVIADSCGTITGKTRGLVGRMHLRTRTLQPHFPDQAHRLQNALKPVSKIPALATLIQGIRSIDRVYLQSKVLFRELETDSKSKFTTVGKQRKLVLRPSLSYRIRWQAKVRTSLVRAARMWMMWKSHIETGSSWKKVRADKKAVDSNESTQDSVPKTRQKLESIALTSALLRWTSGVGAVSCRCSVARLVALGVCGSSDARGSPVQTCRSLPSALGRRHLGRIHIGGLHHGRPIHTKDASSVQHSSCCLVRFFMFTKPHKL
ncbi:hypothetical protein DIPPA_13850 [Diplonema papillatum]|nr:hypothetical protein DIPPA_13850 [Diplonema papillatum]